MGRRPALYLCLPLLFLGALSGLASGRPARSYASKSFMRQSFRTTGKDYLSRLLFSEDGPRGGEVAAHASRLRVRERLRENFLLPVTTARRRMEYLIAAIGPERWRKVAYSGYQNEIPETSSDMPTIRRIRINEDGDIDSGSHPNEAAGLEPSPVEHITEVTISGPLDSNPPSDIFEGGTPMDAPELSPGEGEAGSRSPPVLGDDYCLEPGEPVVRIERAPDNAVRIFTGIDVLAPMEAVWSILTDYDGLQRVIPNLVESNVLESKPCGGATISQVGSAAVFPGVKFTAKMTLDVGIHLEDNPLPEEKIHGNVEDAHTPSSEVREMGEKLPLERGVFPRPYAITQLPHRDITMQNVPGAPGDFDHYQGIWRVQQLPDCAPDGQAAARLTYAVEIKPKGMLPVRLIEKRVASDLKVNLKAIRGEAESRMERSDGPLSSLATARVIT